MSEPHVIRLRGPWATEDGRRVRLPATWADTLGEAESATLSRTFNRPTNLDGAGVSVRIRVASPQAVGRILLNGSNVVDGAEVVALLGPSNRLTVELSRSDPAEPVLEASLEIVDL